MGPLTPEDARAVEALYKTAHWLHASARYADAACVFRVMLLAAAEDERAWLGVGACHEAIGQLALANELYSAGCGASRSARLELARARALRGLGRDEEASAAYAVSHDIAVDLEDHELATLAIEESRP